MFLGGITSRASEGPVDDQLATGPELSLHDQILEAEARAREARAEYWALLAKAQEQAGPSLTRHRNEALWLADSLRVAKAAAGKQCRRGRFLFTEQPTVGQAFADGIINEEHVSLLLRLWSRPELRAAFNADLNALIGFARNDWATCKHLFNSWETLVDPIDPNEYAERAHADRGFDFTEPVSQQVLIEILSTTAAWAQIEPGLNAKVDELFEADWANAQARLGDEATMADLGRNDSQRRHDAFVIIMRQGIAADPALAKVVANIVADDETLEEEAARRDSIARGEEPPARRYQPGEAVARAATRRCETESGLSLSPADALDYAIAAHIRLFRMDTETRDFTASAKTRLFKGAIRTGIMIRDRHCQGAG
ncbi:MAG: DUF222 domain-containing protein [Acidimicrobiales bacterium]